MAAKITVVVRKANGNRVTVEPASTCGDGWDVVLHTPGESRQILSGRPYLSHDFAVQVARSYYAQMAT